MDALVASNNHIHNAVGVLKALQDSPSISKFPICKRTASNALVEKQSFYSTKRKRLPCKAIAKPTTEEVTKSKEILANVEILLCAICFKEDDSGYSDDVDWIQCLKCERWFHLSCIRQGNTITTSQDYCCTICNINS